MQNKRASTLAVVFILVVLGVAFLAPLLGGSPSNIGLGFILWGTAPLLVSMIMRLATKDWSDAGLKFNVKKNIAWFIIAVFAYPIMTLLSVMICGWVSASVFANFSMERFMNAFVPAIPIFFAFSLFEEFGWRGYLVPKLQSTGANPFLANAIVAVVWSAWHLPYFRELSWVYSAENLWTFVPRFFIAMFAFAILYNELTLISKSVWPAVIMHCMMNAFGHPLAADFIRIIPGNEYLASSTGIIMITLSALMGVGLYLMRTNSQKTPYVKVETDAH